MLKQVNYNISIIGGGISGLYTAYNLDLKKYPKIGIFDAGSRLGGRIKTIYYKENNTNFTLELGIQPLLEKLISDFKIKTKSFV